MERLQQQARREKGFFILSNPPALRAQFQEQAFLIRGWSGVCESPKIVSKILRAYICISHVLKRTCDFLKSLSYSMPNDLPTYCLLYPLRLLPPWGYGPNTSLEKLLPEAEALPQAVLPWNSCPSKQGVVVENHSSQGNSREIPALTNWPS